MQGSNTLPTRSHKHKEPPLIDTQPIQAYDNYAYSTFPRRSSNTAVKKPAPPPPLSHKGKDKNAPAQPQAKPKKASDSGGAMNPYHYSGSLPHKIPDYYKDAMSSNGSRPSSGHVTMDQHVAGNPTGVSHTPSEKNQPSRSNSFPSRLYPADPALPPVNEDLHKGRMSLSRGRVDKNPFKDNNHRAGYAGLRESADDIQLSSIYLEQPRASRQNQSLC